MPEIEIIAQGIGVVGVVVVMIAYFLLQIGRMSSESMLYSLLNFFGSGFIVISLVYDWNLPAFLMETSWAIISLYGMSRSYKNKLRK